MFVLLVRTRPARIPDDNSQSVKVKLTLDRNFSTADELGYTVPHSVLNQRLQEHCWHQCIQGVGRNRQIDPQPLSQPRLFNGKVAFRKRYSCESATSSITSLSRLVRKSSPICASIVVAAGAFPSRTSVETALSELNRK